MLTHLPSRAGALHFFYLNVSVYPTRELLSFIRRVKLQHPLQGEYEQAQRQGI